MRLRPAIWIRIVLYGGLIAFFGWRFVTHRFGPAARGDENARQEELDKTKRSVTLPDGSTQDVYYVTPEQAKDLLGVTVPEPTSP